jgi:outer membrane protein assembly factor BamB
MAVIELDRPAPVRERHRRFDLRPAAVVLVLCACLLTASAGPVPDAIVGLWTVRGSAVATTGSSVFILTSNQISAYDLGTGRRLWSRTMATSKRELTVTDPGPVLVPVGTTQLRYLNEFGVAVVEAVTAATVALDPATGAERWRRPGEVVHATPDTTLLVTPGSTVRQIRTADGTVLWSDVVDGATSWAPAGSELQTARIVAATLDGQAVVLRLADGTVAARGDVPGDSVDADSMVYADRTDHGRVTVTAYSLDSLRQAWSVTGRSAGGHAHGCGVVVCFAHDGGVDGLNPATGTALWWVPGWTDATAVAGQSRLIAVDGARHALLDSETGAVVAGLGPGVPVWNRSVPVFYLRPAGAGRVAVDRLDSRTGRLTPRGVMPAGGACTAADLHRLVCTTAGRVAVFSA